MPHVGEAITERDEDEDMSMDNSVQEIKGEIKGNSGEKLALPRKTEFTRRADFRKKSYVVC